MTIGEKHAISKRFINQMLTSTVGGMEQKFWMIPILFYLLDYTKSLMHYT